ncbi:KEOPS complex subunit Pcc1 [Halorubrum trapanicum]|uniref:KEOPS complex subunit Pcc1 n=1 Tax=Halorubrum trapanicum TaxID=29284 RepID=UPI000BBACDBA|nr:KEOPS complex subunit Pcc1 [Halorubrum trapanicum]
MPEETRRTATVRTRHADAATVAAALGPDETDSMRTRVDGDVVACTVARPTTGGLQSTLDDHLVNLRVADRVIDRARDHATADADAANADAADAAAPLDSTDEPQTTDTDTQSDT